ncbi:MAG TPA: ABC transporter ATP-binding protein [Holosporales bacterium]|nr:ABC transporter ATP-binding protein [Holosporales bacterium]
MFLGLFWAIETSLTPYLMKEIIDRATEVSHGSFASVLHVLWPFALAYISMTALNSASFRLREWLLLKTIPSLRKDIWSFLYDYVMAHSYHFFQRNFSGSVANKISDISRSVDEFLTNIAETFLTKIMSILIACVSMYLINPFFALILIVWSTVFLLASLWGAKKANRLAKKYSENLSLMIGKTVDGIANNMNVRLFSRQVEEMRNIQRYLSVNAVKDRNLQRYLIKLRTFQDSTLVIFLAVMLMLLIYLYSQQKVSIGDFAFILTLSISMINGVWLLASELVKLPEILGRFSQGLATLSITHEIQDIENAETIRVKKGKIEFKDVDFCYGAGQQVFKGLNLTIKAGEKVGLVGPSGSGKTTLVNLVLRYYDIQGGTILIDGQDISKVTQSSLRHSVSVIPQDVSLFHRSIMDNIRYGKPKATDKEIFQAAKKANAHDFIRRLEKGYKTIAEERGSNLSGGQRQRVAIARAILKNAPILILDEATSALDPVTEKEIQAVLDKIMGRKTCVVIAHRLSTLIDMDRILVFKDGSVVEEGTHKALLRKKGHYAYLWAIQMGKIPVLKN